eukprot:GHVQ01017303.1.p1 GENE.GHVQ01017303.1~~GHVQ01017303.1.p1  ORF type:complete len:553 (+),score=99.76 GHVQ01017303.1:188-1846(+)
MASSSSGAALRRACKMTDESLAVGGRVSWEGETKFASAEDFENMVGDLRRTFIGWLKKTEMELRRERDGVMNEQRQFEEEKTKVWKQFQSDKQLEYEKIKEERRKTEAELSSQMKQVNIEREDCRRKITDDKTKFEQEREMHRRKMLLDREKFRQEYETFDAERRQIVDSNIAAETMVDLNVGGVVFETSRHTLIQQPGSFIEALLSGRHHVSRDRQGRIFLDRDSELFRIILNFLRNPSTPPMPRDAAESDAVAKEAQFFGIKFFPFPLVFACGGHNGTEHLRAVEVLDIGQQCWRPCRPMETERAYFGSTSILNRLFLYGGQNLDYKALCDMEVYDILRDCWSNGSSLNIPRRNLAGTACGQRLFAIGGFDGTNILSSVECYDPRMKNWMEVAGLSTPRSSAMCCEMNGRIYVLGGTRGERLRTVETYEPRMNKWEELSAEMIEVRSAGSSCCIANHIYAMGGTDNTHTTHTSLEVLDPDAMRWHFAKGMPGGRMDCSCVSLSDSVLVSGGQNGEVLNSIDFYRPEMNDWQPGPPMLFPRYGHALLVGTL